MGHGYGGTHVLGVFVYAFLAALQPWIEHWTSSDGLRIRTKYGLVIQPDLGMIDHADGPAQVPKDTVLPTCIGASRLLCVQTFTHPCPRFALKN
jgi:hypothetical protein